MKKPTIKNWIKYCAAIFAMSGMLLTTSCGSEENQTADYENEIEAVENDPTTLDRENVAEVETDADDRQTTGGTNDVDYANNTNQNQQANTGRSAAAMPNMDQHIEEYEEPNQAIREELTDTQDEVGVDPEAMNATKMEEQKASDTQTTNQYNTADTQQTTGDTRQYQDQTQQNNTLNNTQQDTAANQTQMGTAANQTQQDTATNQTQQGTAMDQQGRENVANTEADRQEQEAMIISLYEIDLENMTEEDRTRVEELMSEYRERRDRERGQMNPETGAYISPEVDARPEMGYEQLMKNIQENIEYPHNAQAAQMEGTVIVNFVVDENGEVLGGKAVEFIDLPSGERKVNQPLNPTTFTEQEIAEQKQKMMMEAVEAVTETSGQWEAAMEGGERVPAEIQLPVRFRITDGGIYEND